MILHCSMLPPRACIPCMLNGHPVCTSHAPRLTFIRLSLTFKAGGIIALVTASKDIQHLIADERPLLPSQLLSSPMHLYSHATLNQMACLAVLLSVCACD
jgi:hypothetical protein